MIPLVLKLDEKYLKIQPKQDKNGTDQLCVYSTCQLGHFIHN